MEIVDSIKEVRKRIYNAKKEEKKVGFVPTMGYLHRGHLSLVEISKKHSGYQVMSIFVNKIQFNEKKDFETYPKDLQRDFELAKDAGVDLMFTPDDEEIYKDHLTYVDVEKLTDHLCGAARPGHFRGVFTVVSKLFNIVQPDISVFGQKDIQQVASIQKMALDLNFPVKIIIAPIVRENDGLAMSSRNKHLSEKERNNALFINKSLKKAEELIASGETQSKNILKQIKKILIKGNPERIDYISIVNYNDLQPAEKLADKSVIAVAVFFGPTRLIDNMIVEKTDGGFKCVY